MVYGSETMLPVEINIPTWRRDNFSGKDNLIKLQIDVDSLKETREMALIQEYTVKQRKERKYNS